jgi:hypothetical protein
MAFLTRGRASVDIPAAEYPHFRVVRDKNSYEADLGQLSIHFEMESIEFGEGN